MVKYFPLARIIHYPILFGHGLNCISHYVIYDLTRDQTITSPYSVVSLHNTHMENSLGHLGDNTCVACHTHAQQHCYIVHYCYTNNCVTITLHNEEWKLQEYLMIR